MGQKYKKTKNKKVILLTLPGRIKSRIQLAYCN